MRRFTHVDCILGKKLIF